MAVIHVTEEEAARDLPALLAKARAGEEILIDSDLDSFALIPTRGMPPKSRTISEAIRTAEARGPGILLDDQFGDDLEEIMRINRLEGSDPWASF